MSFGIGLVKETHLNDVVLDERVLGPTVNGEVAVTVGSVSAGELDSPETNLVNRSHKTSATYMTINVPGTSGVPTLSTDKVTTALPIDAERTSSSVGVGHLGAAIGPPRVVVPVVSTSAARRRLALDQVGGGSGEDSGDGNSAGQERAEGNHDCLDDQNRTIRSEASGCELGRQKRKGNLKVGDEASSYKCLGGRSNFSAGVHRAAHRFWESTSATKRHVRRIEKLLLDHNHDIAASNVTVQGCSS